MSSNNVNAKPCFLNGCQLEVRADGSTTCIVCGLYRTPDVAMVNALLKANAGGRQYRKLAAQVLNQARLTTPQAPEIPAPTEPPPFATAEPSLWVVTPIAAAIGVALGLLAWAIIHGVLL
jgi:hypothetical protein